MMITVIGLGFVGLTTALGFSKKGFKVFGIDVDQQKLENLRKFQVPFHEPHLPEVLREQLHQNFLLDVPLKEAIHKSNAVFICVGTPSLSDGSADLNFIYKAIDAITAIESDHLKVLVIKSTVPPSTMSEKIKPYVSAKGRRNFALASNPEFLREGYSWGDFMRPDRIVIGVEDQAVLPILQEIYKPFDAPLHQVSFNGAEFIKYLSNTMLSTMISYANEMAMIADKIGDIDIAASFRILHGDKRWSGEPAAMASYIYPGCGYGGYCLPKDTSALLSIARAHQVDAPILAANLKINEDVKNFVADKISKNVGAKEVLGVLGLSFKPGSDDVRMSPSKDIIARLLANGHKEIIAYDPMANDAFDKEYHLPIEYADSLDDLLDRTSHLIILTGWKEFKERRDDILKKNVFDFRYLLS